MLSSSHMTKSSAVARDRGQIRIFNTVRRLVGDGEVERPHTDFEMAVWKAFSAVYPGVPIKGRTFHLNQAIFRKVQDLGLGPAYNTGDGTYPYIRKLMALQFLPEQHILHAFNKLQGMARTDALKELSRYFEINWLSNSTWRISNWCMYGVAVRTNNDIEAWHRRLNHRAGRKNMPFYLLVPFLKEEAELIPLQIRLLTDGQLQRRVTKKQKAIHERFFKLWDDYEEGEMSTSKLLRQLSKINGPIMSMPDLPEIDIE